jgi:hypothetical protein
MSGIGVIRHGVSLIAPHIIANGRRLRPLGPDAGGCAMAASDPRETAKIYDLSAFRRARETARVVPDAKPAPVPSFGGAWYHEAAIREDERPRRP